MRLFLGILFEVLRALGELAVEFVAVGGIGFFVVLFLLLAVLG